MYEKEILAYQKHIERNPTPESMDIRNIVICLVGNQNRNQQLVNDATETLHLPVLNNSLLTGSLLEHLERFPPHGYILDNVLKDGSDIEALIKWSNKNNMTLLPVRVEPGEDSQQVLWNGFSAIGNTEKVIEIESSKDFFRKISPYFFEDKDLANKYYQFRDLCREKNIESVLIAGACSYIYWGRWPLKDLDILVPSTNDLAILGKSINQEVDHLISGYADTHYLNFSEGVEIVSDLKVLFEEKEEKVVADFSFPEIMKDAKKVRFLGEECLLMSPEMLVLFKFSLGRFGVDEWGHVKDDYEDAAGVIISQGVNLPSLRERAEKLGVQVRVEVGSSRVDLQACKLEYSIVSPK